MTGLADLTLLPESHDELHRYYGEPPHGVRANMIMTSDGAAAFNGRTRPVTDPADQVLLTHLRMYADVVLVGSGTVGAENYGPIRLDDAQRATREAAGYDPLPRLAVVTNSGALSPALRVFTGDGPRPMVVTCARAVAGHPELNDLAEVVLAGDGGLSAPAVIEALAANGLPRVLCEGGPYLLTTLVEADLVDDMCLTLTPYLAGSQPTTPQPASTRDAPIRLELAHLLQRNGLLYLRYTRQS
jgi:riboflavin biosynthesis pyrimidine reductase